MGTKRQSTKRLHVCSHLEKRAAAPSVISTFHPDARWLIVDRCPTRIIINFVELDATISSLNVSSGARLLQVVLGWPRICSTWRRRRCYKTSSTLALARIHRRKLYDSLLVKMRSTSQQLTNCAKDDTIRFSKCSYTLMQSHRTIRRR
jgi:hypothetical protein